MGCGDFGGDRFCCNETLGLPMARACVKHGVQEKQPPRDQQQPKKSNKEEGQAKQRQQRMPDHQLVTNCIVDQMSFSLSVLSEHHAERNLHFQTEASICGSFATNNRRIKDVSQTLVMVKNKDIWVAPRDRQLLLIICCCDWILNLTS